ncbi:MAG: hypothetical protein PF961_22715 [Planctomycetota bacterium]|jgi:hypothetical protein|nr:hypothetical protein [Planctomycetota bacterium]
MTTIRFTFLSALLALASLTSAADPHAAILNGLRKGPLSAVPNAQLVTPAEQDATLALFQASGYWAKGEVVPVSDMPFTKAYRAIARNKPDKPWLVQLQASYPKALSKGSTVYVSFWMRAALGPKATISLMAAPGSRHEITVGTEWSQCSFPVTISKDIPANTGKTFSAFLGAGKQAIEIGGFVVVDLGQAVNPKTLTTSIP